MLIWGAGWLEVWRQLKNIHSSIPGIMVESEWRLNVFGTVPADYDLGKITWKLMWQYTEFKENCKMYRWTQTQAAENWQQEWFQKKTSIGKLDKTEERLAAIIAMTLALHLTSKCRVQFGRRQEAEYALYRGKKASFFCKFPCQ